MFTTSEELGALLAYNGYNVAFFPETGGDDYVYGAYCNPYSGSVDYQVEAWFAGSQFARATVLRSGGGVTPIATRIGLVLDLALFPIPNEDVCDRAAS